MINAVTSLKPLRHRSACAALAVICAIAAAWLSTAGIMKSLETVVSLNSVFLPTVTIIMIAEFFVVRRMVGLPVDFSAVASLSGVPQMKWPAFIALMVAYAVGIATAGVIPGTEALHVGICSVQAWLVAAALYVPLRLVESKITLAAGTTMVGRPVASVSASDPE